MTVAEEIGRGIVWLAVQIFPSAEALRNLRPVHADRAEGVRFPPVPRSNVHAT